MFYQVTVKYSALQPNGTTKKMSEQVLLEVDTFAQAEYAAAKEYESFDDADVASISRTKYAEVIDDKYGLVSKVDGEAAKLLGGHNKVGDTPDTYFKVRIDTVAVDEKTGVVKRAPQYLLVLANSVNSAHDIVENSMRSSMTDYIIAQVDETKIVEVLKRTE